MPTKAPTSTPQPRPANVPLPSATTGFVIYTDDGERFVQGEVPTRAPLTSVFFLDALRGWAAGHDGTVTATTDGGKTWQVLREMRGQDYAVRMGIWFADAERGLAVGQFGLALETRDGGKTLERTGPACVDGEAGEPPSAIHRPRSQRFAARRRRSRYRIALDRCRPEPEGHPD
ncbi:MAG: YCF48-related protein [Comamonadaceae bacterium]|nr:YCF48-related protein [Comamonadaceae bacterium]